MTTKSILLIEDNEEDRFLFIESLANIKKAKLYDIASSEKEALHMLNTSHIFPDIIFMDIQMPENNGIDYLSELAKILHLKKIPVIVFSSKMKESLPVRSIGANSFIVKTGRGKILPVRIEQMMNLDFTEDNVLSYEITDVKNPAITEELTNLNFYNYN